MRPANQEEAYWVSRVKGVAEKQDQSDFAELFQRYAPKVKAFLMKSGADAASAEECMQEVMVTVWQKSHLFDPSKASVATWIFTIARNKNIDMYRKSRRPEPEDVTWIADAEPSQEQSFENQENTLRLSGAIETLPDAQRDLIEKAFFSEMSHTEISSATGLPLGTIKSRIRLGIEKLRQTLGAEATK